MNAYTVSALAIAVIATAGLVIHSTLPRTGKIRAGFFCFYTNLSNLVIILYEFTLFTAAVLKAQAVYRAAANSTVALSMTACIWVTHLIYHFILLPSARRGGVKLADTADERVGNVFVHYVTPLLVVLQWLLWADKSNLTVLSALAWLIIPLLYFIFAMLRARTGRPIGNTSLLYPYPFLDLPALGAKEFRKRIAVMAGFFFILGLFLAGIGSLLAK